MPILTIILEAIMCCQVTIFQGSLSQNVKFNSGEHLSHELKHSEPGKVKKEVEYQ